MKGLRQILEEKFHGVDVTPAMEEIVEFVESCIPEEKDIEDYNNPKNANEYYNKGFNCCIFCFLKQFKSNLEEVDNEGT